MQQEVEQLRKSMPSNLMVALLSLMEFYKEISQKKIPMPNEPEFQAYYILTLPWSNEVPSRLEQELEPRVFFDPQVQLAFQIRFLLSRRDDRNKPSVDGSLNHYARIFSIIRKSSTSYLFACCIHLHFLEIRKAALKSIQKSYRYIEGDSNSGMDLEEIVTSFGFDSDQDAIAFLNHYFIDVLTDMNGTKRAFVGRKVITDMAGKQKPGEYPKYPYTITPDSFSNSKSKLIEMKREGMSYIDILDGKYVAVPSQSDFKSPIRPYTIPSSIYHPSTASLSEAKKPLFSFKTLQAQQQIQIPSPFKVSPLFLAPPQTLAIPIINLQTNSLVMNPATRAETPVNRLNPGFSPVVKTPLMRPLRSASPTLASSELKSKYLPLSSLEKFESVKDVFMCELIDEQVKSFVTQINSSIRKEMLLKGGLDTLIFDNLLQEVIDELMVERWSTTMKLAIWKNCLMEIASDIVDCFVQHESRRCIAPLIVKRNRYRFYERFGFDRWKYFTNKKSLERQKQILIGKRMVSYLRQSVLIPDESAAYPREAIRVESSNIMIEKKLAALAQEMAEQRATWYSRIELQNQILPYVRELAPHYKVLICTYNDGNLISGTLPWFTRTWLIEKLSFDPTLDPYDNLTILADITHYYDGGESTRILLKHCDSTLLPAGVKTTVYI